MAGNTPGDAVNSYAHEIQRSVSCVAPDVLNVTRHELKPGKVYSLVFGSGVPVKLKGELRLQVKIVQSFKVVEADGDRGPFKVRTTAYMYSVEDKDGQEIFAYHWQPGGLSHVHDPHMHLGAGAKISLPACSRAHFPSGRISIEDFLGVLVDAFEVIPIRKDWKTVLAESKGKFTRWRTW